MAYTRKVSYDVGFKLRAVKCAEEKAEEAVAHEFWVDTLRIHEWCQQKERLMVLIKKHGKLGENGWKALDIKQTMTISKSCFEWTINV